MPRRGPLDVLGTGVTVSCSPLPSHRSPGEEMIVCTGSEAEMCGRERSRECVRERTPTHPSASLYSASAAVANATLRSVVDTYKSLSVADINRDGRRHGRGLAAYLVNDL